MTRIFDISLKDLVQILRDRKTFMFLLIMPIAFTLLFGFAFGGSSKPVDDRLPVGYLDLDGSELSQDLHGLLVNSIVIRIDEDPSRSPADLDKLVSDGKLAAAVIVPAEYGQSMQAGAPLALTFIADSSKTSTSTVQSELLVATNRLASAVRIAMIVSKTLNDPEAYKPALGKTLVAWQTPPIQVTVSSGVAVKPASTGAMSMAHSSPAMMLQFAIAGLLTAATVIVNERKTRSLQRLLTTATSRFQILFGHYLAIFVLIFIQFTLLIIFGQLFLKLDYLRLPFATLLVAICAAACIAALGLLIGVFARSEEQAVMLALIPMFVLSGLGGAWVPLEFTGTAFQTVGHVSPVAWAMDGFENVIARGLGPTSVLVPSVALVGYAVLFFILAAWRFRASEEN